MIFSSIRNEIWNGMAQTLTVHSSNILNIFICTVMGEMVANAVCDLHVYVHTIMHGPHIHYHEHFRLRQKWVVLNIKKGCVR